MKFSVYGTATVSCYAIVEAETATEAIELAKSIDDSEVEYDTDGQPEWTRVRPNSGDWEKP